MTDDHKADLLTSLACLDLTSADGQAGVRAVLRQIEEASPGTIERMAASLQLRSLGSTRH